MEIVRLIENETLKILRRRRLLVVVLIMASILGIAANAQRRELNRRDTKMWRAETQQRIANYQNRLRSGRISATWARSLRMEIARLQYYVDRGIDPNLPTAPLFVRTFANVAGFLLLPLMIAVLGSDIVSAEGAEGTDKLLLTRPVRRWKVLLSKLLTLFMFTTITLVCGMALAFLIGSLVLDSRGWTAPVFTGFVLRGESVDLTAVRQLPLWKDAAIAYGLEWYALLTVASIALLLSVLFRSGAASIGTMLASLIGGTIIARLSPDWTAGKYLFVTALPLADYYTGEPPPYDGMPLSFCIALLGCWAAAALIASFVIFTRRDVMG